MKKIFIFLIAFIAISCNSEEETIEILCIPDFPQGLSTGLVVKVFDASTNEFIDEGITVKAIGEGRTVTLHIGVDSDTGVKNYFGIYKGQEGTYRVNIIGIDYEVFYSDLITISLNEEGCHLDTEHLEVTLQPI